MPKLLGIRDVVYGAGNLPPIIAKAQNMSLMGHGFYEVEGTVEREYTPYQVGPAPPSLGQYDAYDLNEPGRVAEVKRVLIALAKKASDPLQTADPAQADFWKFIDQTSEFADAWDGPTADAFVTAVSRYRDTGLLPALMGEPDSYAQLPQFPTRNPSGELSTSMTWVGGPQPTVAGLELLAQAAKTHLGGSAQLNEYLKWRGGELDCVGPGAVLGCTPPESSVGAALQQGRPWQPRGLTPTWTSGPAAEADPSLVTQLDTVDSQLQQDWASMQLASNETLRAFHAGSILSGRFVRNELGKKLNKGLPPPECGQGLVWDKSKSLCVNPCPEPNQVWNASTESCAILLEPVDIIVEEDRRATLATVAVLSVLAAGGYVAFRGVPWKKKAR